jgi:hypothetical protein
MSVSRTPRSPSLPLIVSLAAVLLSASAAHGQPGVCGPCEGFAGALDEGPPLYGAGEPLPPATIISGPCAFTPHDVDPCYNMRCHLFPASPNPWLYLQAEVAPLFRDPDHDVFFQSAGPQGPIVLGTNTLEPEFQGGLRFLVGGRVNDLYRVETIFVGLHRWNDTDTARDFEANALNIEGNLFSPFTNFGDPALNLDGGPDGVVGVDFNQLASLNVRTTFDSVESNVLVDIPRMRNLESSMMLGVRYLRIDDELAYQTESNVPSDVVESAVTVQNAIDNNLIGLQLGYRGRFLVERRMWLDYDMKGAIYNNTIDHRLSYEQTLGGDVIGEFAGQADVEKTAFGGDLSMVLNYAVTPNIALRLGYQAMWFTGLAVAAENAVPEGVRITTRSGNRNVLIYPPLEVNHQGEVIYHGPVAGVMAMW